MIDYYVLQQLVAFYHTGTLSEASKQLHISQPTLTRGMKKMESEIGVPLFNRSKNSIELNENGILAAEQAEQILNQTKVMIDRVRALDKSNRTIALGSCARAPVPDLVRRISMFYPEASISSEVKRIPNLLEDLENGNYQLIVLPLLPDNSNLVAKAIGEEHLMFCLPEKHHFAGEKALTLEDMNGQNILFYHNNGFWEDVVQEKMPESYFLVQNERYSFHELAQSSILPFFTSDVFIRDFSYEYPKDRVVVPITNPEANVTFYLVCRKENRDKFSALFS